MTGGGLGGRSAKAVERGLPGRAGLGCPAATEPRRCCRQRCRDCITRLRQYRSEMSVFVVSRCCDGMWPGAPAISVLGAGPVVALCRGRHGDGREVWPSRPLGRLAWCPLRARRPGGDASGRQAPRRLTLRHPRLCRDGQPASLGLLPLGERPLGERRPVGPVCQDLRSDLCAATVRWPPDDRASLRFR